MIYFLRHDAKDAPNFSDASHAKWVFIASVPKAGPLDELER
jgi:hypothetical protein